MNTNGNYYVNRLRRRESFKRLINIGLNLIQTHLFILEIITDFQVNLVRMAEHQVFIGCPKSLALATWIGSCH